MIFSQAQLSLLFLALVAPATKAFVVPSSSHQTQQPNNVQQRFLSSDAASSTSETQDNNIEGNNEKAPVIEKPPVPEGSHEELMYALGVNLARQLGDVRPLVENGDELASVAKGLLDCVVGRFDEPAQLALLQRRGKDLNEVIKGRADAIKERMESAGNEMLEEMAKTEGAEKLDSGVVVHVLEYGPEGKGQGKRATKASTVKIHYHGTLADGTVFDSTLGGEEPVVFPLAGVIPGWRDGVLKMHEGETAMIGIPPKEAYGDAGTPDGRIPGGSTLFFKIQLLEIMTASIGGTPDLLGADGKKVAKDSSKSGSGLLGVDGKPL